jgi:hypothetical protein
MGCLPTSLHTLESAFLTLGKKFACCDHHMFLGLGVKEEICRT